MYRNVHLVVDRNKILEQIKCLREIVKQKVAY